MPLSDQLKKQLDEKLENLTKKELEMAIQVLRKNAKKRKKKKKTKK